MIIKEQELLGGAEMILITGGAGYIGSHTCIELMLTGRNLVILDNLCNSSIESLKRIELIVGRPVIFVNGDIRSREDLIGIFTKYNITEVLHFAGLKSVGESVIHPLQYYENNVLGTLTLCNVMAEFGCKSLVFSSSATVYGNPISVPIRENFPLSATSPYGRTKLIIEDILRDLYVADGTWRIALLRYFNPIGAHESGLIGENPNGIPNNLLPFIGDVAVGKRPKLFVFGGDYSTPDGTGIRDYIHVVDLAKAHIKALDAIKLPTLITVNLGTGIGYSVLEIIKAFEHASKRKVDYEIIERRPGDIAQCYADPSYARQCLEWKAERNLSQMCEDTWRWQVNNPNGFN